MQKSSLWNAMVDVNFSDDITLGGCFRDYFPESQYEILGSSSGTVWYVFKDVTVPASVNNCSYKGNGILEEVFYSFNGALNFVKSNEQNKKIAKQSQKKEKNKTAKQLEEENKLIPISSGTAFFINKKSNLVTNHHVINTCQEVAALISGELYPLKIIASDIANDLTLAEVKNYKNSRFLPISVEGASLGDNVIAAGFPLSTQLSDSIKVTKGIISSMSGINNNYSQYQIDAAVQRGNSGGPLIDDSGNVIGVVVSQVDKFKMLQSSNYIPENINFAVKSQNLKVFLEANNTPYSSNNSSSNLSSRLVAESAKNSTLMLLCFNSLSNLKKMYGEENVSSIYSLKDLIDK